MAKRENATIQIPSAKNGDQPATRRMLSLVRDELKSEIRALDRKADARFVRIESRLTETRDEMKTAFAQMESRLGEMKDEMKTELIRTQILLEEQHSNNRIVLEGLQALWQRQDRIEKKVDRSSV